MNEIGAHAGDGPAGAHPVRRAGHRPERRQRRRSGRRGPTWRMRPATRKLWLVLHVGISVGWFGGGYAMLVMGIVAMTNVGRPLRPAAYELIHLSDTAIMIPFSLCALVTGLVVGLYTKWRVLWHWWVVAKLVLTIGAMIFAYAYVAQNIKAALALTEHDLDADIGGLQGRVIAGSCAILAVLACTTILSIYKPWGRTRWGRRAGGTRVRKAPDPYAPGHTPGPANSSSRQSKPTPPRS